MQKTIEHVAPATGTKAPYARPEIKVVHFMVEGGFNLSGVGTTGFGGTDSWDDPTPGTSGGGHFGSTLWGSATNTDSGIAGTTTNSMF